MGAQIFLFIQFTTREIIIYAWQWAIRKVIILTTNWTSAQSFNILIWKQEIRKNNITQATLNNWRSTEKLISELQNKTPFGR